MLRELTVRNLAVIETVTVPFGPGLNVLTGETGAGKSILIDALTLLLGERAQTDAIRAGAETATIAAVFEVEPKGPVAALLDELGYPPEEPLILRRELSRAGRSRAFVNDSPATLALLDRLGEALVELHGQHEHQALLRPARHLELLDAYAGLAPLREEVRRRYEEWSALKAELAGLRAAEQDRTRREELARFELEEIDAARLSPGEEDELRAERRRLQNAERLFETASQAYAALYDDPASAVGRIALAAAQLRDLARVDDRLGPILEGIESAGIQLDEAVRALRGYREGIVFDPARLEAVERRLGEIDRLKRKYGESIGAILEAREARAREIEALGRGEARSRELTARLTGLREGLATEALTLSRRRERVAEKLARLVVAELAGLGMADADFRVRLQREPAGEGGLAAGPEGWQVGPRGVDHAEFLFAANPGEEPKPLTRIASGGELSRTMLALKVLLAQQDAVPVLIFDEVDAGIGGRTADTVGRKLRLVARSRQVLCVTHLPQIACYADHHLRVEKEATGERVRATISPLAREERVREVARMLGGEAVTEASLRHARELIAAARGRSASG